MADQTKNTEATRNPTTAPPIVDTSLKQAGAEWEEGERARSPFYEISPLGLVFANTPADALARARTSGKINEYSPNTIQVEDTVITALDASAARSLGVGETKMLKAGILAFTAVNNNKGQNPPTLRVVIDTADYARKCGVEIRAQQMPTPEAQAAEDRRAENAAHNFLAKTRRNLNNLMTNAVFSWTDTAKGKVVSYNGVSFISGYKVTRKYISMDFGLRAAEYLMTRHYRQEPDTLFLVDERREDAYAIGDYLNEHYSIDNNVTRDIEHTLSISSILAHTSIPKIEEIRQNKGKSKRTWRDLIRDRFESALDELTRVGFLSSWAYSYSKKRLLTDAEIDSISSYDEFASLYLYYNIANYPKHSERVKAITTKRKEAARRGAKKRQKTKAEDSE